MKQLPKAMVIVCAASLLSVTPPASARQPKDKPQKANAPQKTGQEKKTPLMRSGDGVSSGSPDEQGEDLFEIHVRVRRTAGGVHVLVAGTVPSAQDAATAAEHINQVRDHGMVGLVVLPLIVNTNPDTNRALRAAWGSLRAEAGGSRLAVTASIPDKAIAAGADAVNVAFRFVKRLVGQN